MFVFSNNVRYNFTEPRFKEVTSVVYSCFWCGKWKENSGTFKKAGHVSESIKMFAEEILKLAKED